MTMRQKTIFICLFCAMLLLPLLLLDTKTVVSVQENRNLAMLPKPINKFDINWKFFSELDEYIKDRFGFRDYLIVLNMKIQYGLLGRQGNSRALIGKDGWLYYIDPNYGANYSDFMKLNTVSASEVEEFVKAVKDRADWCEQNGIKFLLLIPPNKHNVYPEYYPFVRPGGLTRTEQFITGLQKTNVHYIYPRDVLIANKNISPGVYYKTDTHWNPFGALLAYEEIKKEMKRIFPRTKFADIEFTQSTKEIPGRGDIVPMLGLTTYGNITDVKYRPKGKTWADIYTYEKNLKKDGIVAVGKNSRLPTAIIYRDSFSNSLEPFTSTLFSRADYVWKWFEGPDKEYVLANKPDIVIWEIVEKWTGGIPDMKW